MQPDDATLRDRYGRAIERAAAAGMVPPSGLTPREQSSALSEHTALSADTRGLVRRLVDLFEQVVYGGRRDQSDQVAALCDQLADALPTVPGSAQTTERSRTRRFGWIDAIAKRVPWIVVIALAALTVILASLAFTQFTGAVSGFGGRGASSNGRSASNSGASLNASIRSERDRVASYLRAWRTSSSEVTWSERSVPSVVTDPPLETRPDEHGTAFDGSDFDLGTGEDCVFVDAVDPFDPPLHFTHRRSVYTAVDSSFRLGRALHTPGDVVQSPPIGPLQREWTGTVTIDLAGGPIRIPTPTPDFQLLNWSTSPRVPVRFERGPGDELLLYPQSRARQRIEMHYRIQGDGTHSTRAFMDEAFSPRPQSLPENVRREAEIAIGTIGGLPAATWAKTVERLHAYFATFSVAPIMAREKRSSDYLTITLARKGVCRHRAHAFFITAMALGIETRYVENRIHAFCEVRQPDGTWRRLEFRLGENEPGLPIDLNRESAAGLLSMQPISAAWAWIGVLTVLGVLLWFGVMSVRDRAAWRLHAAVRDDVGEPKWNDQSGRRVMHQLLEATRLLLESRFGPNLERLRDEAEPAPASIRARIAELQRAWNAEHSLLDDDETLSRTYWNCIHVFRWLRRRNSA